LPENPWRDPPPAARAVYLFVTPPKLGVAAAARVPLQTIGTEELMNTHGVGTPAGTCTKRLYKQPILRVYGGIQDLTETTANMGANSDTRGFFMDSRTH
jgi:hypothetical protein